DAAEFVCELNLRGRDRPERPIACSRIRLAPGREPSIDERRRALVDGGGNQIGEQGQLEAPALHVFVTRFAVRELVREWQQRTVRMGVEPDGDPGAAGRTRLAVLVSVRERNAL